MEIKSFQYMMDRGFTVDKFPSLDSENTLVLIFASPIFKNKPEPIQKLKNFYNKSIIIGCSTAGEIFGEKIYDNSISISIIKFQHTKIKGAKAEILRPGDCCATGEAIAHTLYSNSNNPHNIFVLSIGLNVNGTELVKGLNSKVTSDVIITGGLAGDGSDFKKTWVIFNGEILTNHVVAVAFYGEKICVGYSFNGGWNIFGPERRITRSEGRVLFELDNQPALSLYKKYLGARSAELPSSGLLYPLAIRDPNRPKEATQLVRTILNIDENNQSLIFAGDMPTGYYAQLMHANFDRLILSASEAGKTAGKMLKISSIVRPVLAIDISCIGRRLLLGERTEEETEATIEILPKGSTQIGFYSYGELSPAGERNCELHNQTMTITTVYEKD